MSPAPAPSPRRAAAVRNIATFFALVIPLVIAASLGWRRAWIFLGLFLATILTNSAVMRRKNPGLMRARLTSPRPSEPFDRHFTASVTIVTVALFLIAAADHWLRFSPLGPVFLYVGIALHAAGAVPLIWVIASNPFLEPTVRIQTDRGHTLVRTGPYRYVRHPMYSSVILMESGWPLILGSGWAIVPYACIAALFIVRTASEDCFLSEHLAGYSEYKQETRWRLLPGIY